MKPALLLAVAGLLAPNVLPGQSSLSAQPPDQRTLLFVREAGCGFVLPPDFQPCPPASDVDAARRARIFCGAIEGESCYVSVNLDRGEDLTTAKMITRTAASKPLDQVRFVEVSGEPGADVRWTGQRFAVRQRVVGRGKQGIELEVQVPVNASAGIEGCARAILDSLVLLPLRQDAGWHDADVRLELRRCFPGKTQDRLRVFKSAHYILLTDASARENLLAFLEESAVPSFLRLFPWADAAKSPRLLEVVLFRNESDYQDYCVGCGFAPKVAARTRGHASGLRHATWYESPRDPVSFHEAIHQLVAAWARLDGGGAWFQEGLAEYAEASFLPRNLHRLARNQVRSGTQMPLRKLIALDDLLESDRSGAAAQDRYNQVASLVGFVHEMYPARFRGFVEELGVQPAGEVELLEAAVRRSLGIGIEELEEAWRTFLLREGALAQR